MLAGILSSLAPCQPAWSRMRMAWVSRSNFGGDLVEMKLHGSLLQAGSTRATPAPRSGQTCTEQVGRLGGRLGDVSPSEPSAR
jgi:hypothetical protein